MNPRHHWWPVVASADLRGRPLARSLCGIPLVLFRTETGVAALLDRCPHRHAPLSAGKLCGSAIQCPYHGWRFDGRGTCRVIPGLELKSETAAMVPAYAAQELHGLVWACLEPQADTPPPSPPTPAGDVDRFIMHARVRSDIASAAENFLDGTHTHFVHAGWVRSAGRRQTFKARVKLGPDGAEAEYTGEGRQSGWISRLFEPDRLASWGRFRPPGVAEIEYRGRQGLSLMVTTYLTPAEEGHLEVHSLVMTRRGLAPAALKRWLLKPLFARVLAQDAAILALQQQNRARHEPEPFLDSKLDLLGPHIRRLLRDEVPADAPVQERSLDISL